MNNEKLVAKARKYIAEHSEYSEVFGQTFVAVDTLTAMVGFSKQETKELEKENKQAKGIIRELAIYVRDNCYTRTLSENLDRQGLLEKAEAFINKE